MLFYVAELFKQYIEPFKEKIYRLNQIELPTPQFYLFYNGRKDEPEKHQMKLSTAFKNFSGLELIVNFYNLNEGNNEKFIQQCKSLNHYCIFVNRIEKNKKSRMDLESAFKEAFNYCKNHDVMAEYLESRKKELVSMYGFEYDDDNDPDYIYVATGHWIVYLYLPSVEVQEYNPPHYQIAGLFVGTDGINRQLKGIHTIKFNWRTKETFYLKNGYWYKEEVYNDTRQVYYEKKRANALFRVAYGMNFYD